MNNKELIANYKKAIKEVEEAKKYYLAKIKELEMGLIKDGETKI